MLYQHIRAVSTRYLLLLTLLAPTVFAGPLPRLGVSSNPEQLTRVGDLVFFISTTPDEGRELYCTDGTPEGTRLVAELAPGPASPNLHAFTAAHGRLWFGTETGAWASDGTRSGTVRVKAFDKTANVLWFLPFAQEDVIFAVKLGDYYGPTTEIWVSDGTEAGTRLLRTVSSSAWSPFEIEGEAWFGAYTPQLSFIRTNGRDVATYPIETGISYFELRDRLYGFDREELFALDNRVQKRWTFDAENIGHVWVGERVAYFGSGGKLWQTDGTLGGTRLVAEDFGATRAFVIGDRLYFVDGRGDRLGLWTSDGSAVGTRLVSDAVAPDLRTFSPDRPASLGERLVFTYKGAPWISDATAAGTIPLGPVSASAGWLTTLGDEVLFVANHPVLGRELFITDGTPDGTRMLANIARDSVIEGRVTDADGKPLAGVTVDLLALNMIPIGVVTSMVTDANGAYRFDGLPREWYGLQTRNDLGYVDRVHPDVECGRCPILGTIIKVSTGDAQRGYDFRLRPGGRIAGRVTGAGRPLANITVKIFDANGVLVAQPVTGSDGRYVMPRGLQNGTYSTETANSAGWVDRKGNAALTVTAGITIEADFDLERRGRIRGALTDATSGLPLDAQLRFTDAAGTIRYVDATGSYDVDLVAGEWELVATGPKLRYATAKKGPIAVRNGDEHVVDLAFARIGVWLEGRVLDTNGAPVAGVTVSIYDAELNRRSATLTTDAAGRWATSDLFTEKVRVVARPPKGSDFITTAWPSVHCLSPCDPPSAGDVLVLKEGQQTTDGIDITLKRAARVFGRVVDSHGVPLSAASVAVRSSRSSSTTKTNADGRFSHERLEPDAYQLEVSGEGFALVRLPEPIRLEPGGSHEANVAIPILGPRVRGRVTDAATGLPIAGAGVTLWTNNLGGSFVSTAADGTYSFQKPPADEVSVLVIVNAKGYVSRRDDGVECLRCNTADRTRRLTNDTTTTIDFAMRRGGVVFGRVTDARTGRGVRTFVSFPTPGAQFAYAAPTDDAGYFRSEPVFGNFPFDIRVTAFGWEPRLITPGVVGRADIALTPQPAAAPTRFSFADAITRAPLAGIGVELYVADALAYAPTQRSDATGLLSLDVAQGEYQARAVGEGWATTALTPVMAGSEVALLLHRSAVHEVLPADGRAGTRVTLRGGGFGAGAVVLFGTTRATIVALTPDAIEVLVPPGAGKVDVTVNAFTLPSAFTYVDACGTLEVRPSTRADENSVHLRVDTTSSPRSEIRWYRGSPLGVHVPLASGVPSVDVIREPGALAFARVTVPCRSVDVEFDVGLGKLRAAS